MSTSKTFRFTEQMIANLKALEEATDSNGTEVIKRLLSEAVAQNPKAKPKKKSYAMDNMRGFANEFRLWAFDSVESRDAWVAEDEEKREAIGSLKEIRALLKGEMQLDLRYTSNFYIRGSEDSKQAAKDLISYARCEGWLPNGACSEPVAY